VLRLAVLLFGLALLLGGVITLSYDMPGLPLWLLIAGAAITAGTALERVFYKPLLRGSPGAGWQRTGERFIDPESGRMVDVFYNASSGQRQYVAQDRNGADRT
jgi:hypothetical protein